MSNLELMALKKCKSCGGTLTRKGSCYVCDYCQTKWLADLDNDVHAVERVNAWDALRQNDFEKAAELFENIILKVPQNAEAYWGRALAINGIVYVTDYSEHKKVPTCNNIKEESFLDNLDVQKALSYATPEIRESYQKQADQIEKIRVEWLEKASKEQPYDIFICFKDSDRERGIERTKDSVDVQDLYTALVQKGYKVFFSRVSLRGKISEQYEPYIYGALKTAKVMIVFGEKAEYFNAVWVKNEWSRYKAHLEKGEKHKNSLIIVYKDVDPYDIPFALTGGREVIDYGVPSNFEVLMSHIAKVLDESDKAKIRARDFKKNSEREREKDRKASELMERERIDFNTFLMQLKEIENSRKGRKKLSILSQMFSGISDEADESEKRLIKTYRLPDTLSILIEFINFAAASVDFDTYNPFSQTGNSYLNSSKQSVARTWVEKIEEAYDKARRYFPNEQESIDIEFVYNKTKRRIRRERIKYLVCFAPLIILIIFGLLNVGDGTGNQNMIMSEISWPKSNIAQIVPEPESKYGKIEWEAYYGFAIYLGNTTQTDYQEYVDLCWNSGFNIDYSRDADCFLADNIDGYKLEIRYQEGDIIFIHIDARGD